MGGIYETKEKNMGITENQRSVIKAVSVLGAALLLWTSAFSVSAQTVSDESSNFTETQVSEDAITLPGGDTISGTPSSNVAVEEGVTVDIKVGTKEYESYEVPQSTVKEALNHVNIKLGKYDTVNKSLNTKVKDNTKIKVNRVSYKKTTKTEKVKFKTVKKKTNSLYVGQSKVYKKGKNGTKKVTYTAKVVNGKVKKTVVSGTNVTKKAKNKVVLVGTKRKNYWMIADNPTTFNTKSSGGAGTLVDHNGKTIAYTKVVSGSATAYYAAPGAHTSVGDTVHVGGVAVDPSIIPYGSHLYIQTPDGSFVYGYAVANDTGGFADDGSAVCDLYYDTYDQCVQFGRRDLNVYVLA